MENHKKHLVTTFAFHALNDGLADSLIILLPFVSVALGFGLTESGILSSLLKGLGVFMAIPAGWIAAKLGRFNTLLFLIVLCSAGFLGVGLSNNYFHVLLSFIVSGIAFGSFHPIATAIVSRMSEKEHRGQMLGDFTSIGDVGRIFLTSTIPFFVRITSWRTASFLYGISGVLIAIVFATIINKNGNHVHQEKEKKNHIQEYLRLIRNKEFIVANLVGFLDGLGSSPLFTFLPFLLISKGIDSTLLGPFAAAFIAGTFAGKMFLGRLTDKLGYTKVIVFGEVIMALLICLLVWSSSIYLIIPVSIMLGIVTKGTAPVLQVLIGDAVNDEEKLEEGYGFYAFVRSLGMVIAPIMYGLVGDLGGINLVFYLMVVFVLVALVPLFIFKLIDKD